MTSEVVFKGSVIGISWWPTMLKLLNPHALNTWRETLSSEVLDNGNRLQAASNFPMSLANYFETLSTTKKFYGLNSKLSLSSGHEKLENARSKECRSSRIWGLRSALIGSAGIGSRKAWGRFGCSWIIVHTRSMRRFGTYSSLRMIESVCDKNVTVTIMKEMFYIPDFDDMC